MSIEAGSVVQLKSGGPKMTVQWTEDEDAICTWFAGGESKSNKFSIISLKEDEG